MRRIAAEIEQLQRVNQQQSLLIHVLCDAYNSPQNRGQLFTVLENHCQLQRKILTGQRGESSRLDLSQGAPCINELEMEIAEQDRAYQELEERLRAYNDAARQYEDELARIGEGNAKILASFQRNANASPGASFSSSISVEGAEHSVRGRELIGDCQKIRKQNEESQNLRREILVQISKSQEECATLEKRISRTKQQLNDSLNTSTDETTLQAQIDEQELLIASLNQEIDEANATIGHLKRENQSLRDRLQNPD
jgi:predicted RNase H-like nuclease (RuvC/YqgF family)